MSLLNPLFPTYSLAFMRAVAAHGARPSRVSTPAIRLMALMLLAMLAFALPAGAAGRAAAAAAGSTEQASGTGFAGMAARASSNAASVLDAPIAPAAQTVLDPASDVSSRRQALMRAMEIANGNAVAMAAPRLREGSAGFGVSPGPSATLNGLDTVADFGLDGTGTKVAVLDTGVDSSHPDLRSRLLDEQCFCSGNTGERGCCPNGRPTQSGVGAAKDDNGHGTNVAGIIVGQGGVAPRGATPNAQLIAIKVADRNNRFCCSSDLTAALEWLLAHHPDVDAVNLSLGTDPLFAGNCDLETPFTRGLAKAVDALVAAGAVVTVSAGNHGNSGAMAAPACLRNTLSVGATWTVEGAAQTHLGCTESATSPRQTACFSNRSPTTDVYAAGAFVVSTGIGGGISTFGGTSQAAPMVAACTIALKQAAPLASPEQRMNAIRLSSEKVRDAVSGRSYPFLDCVDAVGLLNPTLAKAMRSRPGIDATLLALAADPTPVE